MQAKASNFTHNDGRSVTLLQLEGTIPIWYKGGKYNIPITMWLLELFPRVPPLVYVTPTRDMIIRPRHSHVDPSGLVDVPYLREWVFQSSSILDLIQICCIAFGQETPLYSCQQQRQPPPQPQPQAQPQPGQYPTAQRVSPPPGRVSPAQPQVTHDYRPSTAGPGSRGMQQGIGTYDRNLGGQGSGQIGSFPSQALGSSGRTPAGVAGSPVGADPKTALGREREGGAWGALGANTKPGAMAGSMTGNLTGPLTGNLYTGSGVGAGAGEALKGSPGGAAGTGLPASPSLKVDVVDVFRRNAVAALTSRLERDVGESCQDASRKIESMLGVQQLLRDRRQLVDAEVRELQQEKGTLEQALQVRETPFRGKIPAPTEPCRLAYVSLVFPSTEPCSLVLCQPYVSLALRHVNVGWHPLTHVVASRPVQACLTQANALETWLSANGQATTELDPDRIFEPTDALSRQLLDCISSDLAIEDTMYALDKAVQVGAGGGGGGATGLRRSGSGSGGDGASGRGGIAVDTYLREVRSLAREQFTFRALELKIRAAQRSARVAQMASAAPVSGGIAMPVASARPLPSAQGASYPRV